MYIFRIENDKYAHEEKYSELEAQDMEWGLKETVELKNIPWEQVDKYNGKHVVYGLLESLGQSDHNPYWINYENNGELRISFYEI